MTRKITIAVCGPSECGKDEFSVQLAEVAGLTYTKSTSEYATPDVFQHWGSWQGYEDEFACWQDRRNHKDEWANIIDSVINADDKAMLYRRCAKEQDILTGIRRRGQFEAVREAKIVDLWVWVDRPGIAVDPNLEYTKEECDLIVDNSGTLTGLYAKATVFGEFIRSMRAA